MITGGFFVFHPEPITYMEDRIPSFFRFEDLRVYGKAVDYSRWLVSTLRDARNEGERSLCHSFFNSAMEISINIVEGSSRNKNQFDHYLKIVKTAIRECVIYTAVAKGLGMLTDEESEHSRELLMELTRMIGALIISLQRGSRRSRENSYGTMMQEEISDIDAIDTDLDSAFDEIAG